MIEAGDSADHARAMYDESVTTVVVAAVVVAALASVGSRSSWPGCSPGRSREVGAAARRIADGDYAARVPREGPEEIASLADSFNQMAASLEEQERMRRDFIANAAHELRTPLTNLQGYLEALRDGVIVADRATYESLWEEAERLVRLSRSLDALAEGDAAAAPPGSRTIDLAVADPHGARARPARPRARRARSSSSTLPERLPARANPTTSPRSSATSSRTPSATRPAGGTVTVRAERRPADLLVSVANTGDGIPPDDLDRVFERFYRVEKSRDRARGGAGIGLAIVKQLVEAGGGRVGAESARRPDALLVQPPGLTAEASGDARSRPSRRRSRPGRTTGSA